MTDGQTVDQAPGTDQSTSAETPVIQVLDTDGQSNTSESIVTAKVYPTIPDENGYFFENADDDADGIFTKVYANGNKVKKTTLPASKAVAIVHELLGKDTKEIAKFMDKDPEKYQMASVTVATTIDEKRQTFEFYERMKMKDYNRILAMYQDLNF
jgi:hypothetical protein